MTIQAAMGIVDLDALLSSRQYRQLREGVRQYCRTFADCGPVFASRLDTTDLTPD